jgi:hypothetical protein
MMNEERRWNEETTQRDRAIEQVYEGMAVVDSAGEELGKVEFVKMGDPNAATTRGNVRPSSGLVEVVREAFAGDEPDLPAAKREQLLRYGYIKIDGPGLTDTDRYVRSDRIGGVTDDRVILTVTKAQLPSED